jgi:hypothetical protein
MPAGILFFEIDRLNEHLISHFDMENTLACKSPFCLQEGIAFGFLKALLDRLTQKHNAD